VPPDANAVFGVADRLVHPVYGELTGALCGVSVMERQAALTDQRQTLDL
jgi:hypothetical protein